MGELPTTCLCTCGVTILDSLAHQKKKRARRRRREVEPRLDPLFTLFNWVNLCQLCMLLSLTLSVVLCLTPTNNPLLLKLNSLCISSLVMVYLKVLGFACWASLTGCFTLISNLGMQSWLLKKLPAQAITRYQLGL